MEIGNNTLIMGIINVTPDSFSGDGFSCNVEKALERAAEMVEQGADIIDVGGESTRPNALPVSLEEEIKRVIPLIKELSKTIDKPISIDTYKSVVAAKALEAGARIINDVSGLQADKDMVNVAAANKAPVVLMHMKGTPCDMQVNPVYKDVVAEIIAFFKNKIDWSVNMGIDKQNIIIDPGIGFGKTVKHNLEILNRLDEFKIIGCPLMVGVSRKSFINKILRESAGKGLLGSLATVAVAVLRGANIVRVHDVKETAEIVKMCDAIKNQEPEVRIQNKNIL